MRSKGLIAFISTVFSLICIYYLSFTYYVYKVEKNAEIYAKGDPKKEKEYLEKASQKSDRFLFLEYNYEKAKEKALNLGLDLKGGLNVILEFSEKDFLLKYSNYSTNPLFLEALKKADFQTKEGKSNYLEVFFRSFELQSKTLAPKDLIKLAEIFTSKELKSSINEESSDKEVKKIISEKIKSSVEVAYEVIRSRIDRFGVIQPNIQKVENANRILVELPGLNDIDRVKKLLQSTAQLGFWEVYSPQEFYPYLQILDKLSEGIIKENEQLKSSKKDKKNENNLAKTQKEEKKSLFTLLNFSPSRAGAIGYVDSKDKELVDKLFKDSKFRTSLPSYLEKVKFFWSAKPTELDKTGQSKWQLYALRFSEENAGPALSGEVVESAERNFGRFGEIEVGMQMNTQGAKEWKAITAKNQNRCIAVVLDNLVYTAPFVNVVIPDGRSSITGNFSMQEAEDLINVLSAGKLPVSAQIIQAEIVGPSLGKEAIKNGVISSLIAVLVVFAWMIFYYMRAGLYANLALVFNLIFIFGILISLGAVLTLPGIAGIVLTLAMAIDANILLYERVKEEIHKGKSIRQAIDDGYSLKGALSSIVDGQITTFITGGILFVFGKGPIQGFATTLIIGIFTSIFSAVWLTRWLIEWHFSKNKKITFFSKTTEYFFKNINYDFLAKRKKAYIFSALLMLIAMSSFFIRKFDFGVDFVGGRTYIVGFDKDQKPEDISSELKNIFLEKGVSSNVEVKTFGGKKQLKLTTKYKSEENKLEVENEILQKLFGGLKKHFPAKLTFEEFKNSETKNKKVGVLSSIKVGPGVAKDITKGAFLAVGLSLIGIFLYIWLRFKRWQLSLGAVLALLHDALVVLGVFSLFYGFLPFSLEIDQAFIAAILTVIGYSINDSVIVYDRIREYILENPKKPLKETINEAISSTLSRTINTSLITLFVIFVIFIFGGESIKGFMFALLVGVGFGTYSSVFVGASLTYDFVNWSEKNKKIKK